MRALAFLALTGCAQVLGLDETRFEPGGPDADIDAPGICDGLPAACTSSAGRSLCGQLRLPGGDPLRGASPAGLSCLAGGEGPCQFAVTATSYETYTTSAPGEVMGSIDDCGRWVVPDFDPAVPDVVVLFDAIDHIQTATLVRGRSAEPGVDSGLEGYAVSQTQLSTWGGAAGALTQTGFLVSYRRGVEAPGTPSEQTQVARNAGGPMTNPVGTTPWAVYFEGTAPFGVISSSLDATGPSGTALTVIDQPTDILLKGLRTGKRCEVAGLHQVPAALIYLTILDC